MKRYISSILAVILLALSLSMGTSAADGLYLIGDADLDGEVSVLDATRIRRWLAGLDRFGALQLYLADADGSGDVNILDATAVQRELVGLGEGFYRYTLAPWRAEIGSLCSDIPIDGIRAGDRVRFDIAEAERDIPSEYEVYVDGILCRERSAEKSFSHTFAADGYYLLSVIAYDPFGGSDVYTVGIQTVPPAEPPAVTSISFDRISAELRVTAGGGTAPYKYQYTIRNNIAPLPPGQAYACDDFDIIQDENGEWVLRCEYCEESLVTVPVFMLSKTLSYYCEVRVRDSAGSVSEIKRIQLEL